MKTLLIFVAFLGISVAGPIPLSYSIFGERRLHVPNRFLSVEEFAIQLQQINSFVDRVEVIPKELQNLLKSITVDDYEAFNVAFEIFRTGGEMCSDGLEWQKRFSHFYNRVVGALEGLLRRIDNLSRQTKLYLANVYLLGNVEKNTIIRYFVSWPQEVHDEIDEIFPTLSIKAKESFNNFRFMMNDEEEAFEYPRTVPDCTTEGELSKACSDLFKKTGISPDIFSHC
ncbi:hypothetical protein QR680_013809 [Steinernema hermaphroditum]|uniref:Uncharacterized protein n=1 Tax=Steinernema hermaphroditum TaxID=289476 RepID=A0AA39I8C9_9BILA|nr:hypothetical protein QR680_013809 [Steinernema hermaphroditum]